MYQLIVVRPYGIPEEWIFQIEGKATDIEIAKEIQTYLYELKEIGRAHV